MRKQKTLTLDESTAELLDRQANIGRYLDAIVQRSWGRCSAALNILLLNGWSSAEIMEAATSLNSTWEGIENPADHSATMSRSKPGISAERWSTLASEVAFNPVVAFALDILASEYWSCNTHLRGILADGKTFDDDRNGIEAHGAEREFS